MRIHRALRRPFALVGIAAILGASMLAGTSAAAAVGEPGVRPQVRPADSVFYWKWSDGSQRSSRTFREFEHGYMADGSQLELPGILFMDGQYANRKVRLQNYVNGRWITESWERTDEAGVAQFYISPFCGDVWCNDTYYYRLKVGRVPSSLIKVRFVANPPGE